MKQELDYDKLKKSLAFFVERYMPTDILTSEAHPVRVLERMENERMAMARRGLIVASADMIEATRDLPPPQVRDADSKLEELGAYTLTFLRSKFTRSRSK